MKALTNSDDRFDLKCYASDAVRILVIAAIKAEWSLKR
jgi:hypothetical protein